MDPDDYMRTAAEEHKRQERLTAQQQWEKAKAEHLRKAQAAQEQADKDDMLRAIYFTVGALLVAGGAWLAWGAGIALMLMGGAAIWFAGD